VKANASGGWHSRATPAHSGCSKKDHTLHGFPIPTLLGVQPEGLAEGGRPRGSGGRDLRVTAQEIPMHPGKGAKLSASKPAPTETQHVGGGFLAPVQGA